MRKSYFVLILCAVGYLLSLLSRSCPTVLVDYMALDFAFTPQNIGYVSAATMFSYGFMQLPAGILADAFGPRKILIIFTLIAGFSTLCFAFSQTQTQVIISRFFIGVGVSLSVISITMLSLWFIPQTFARANSILCGISELGPVLAATPLFVCHANSDVARCYASYGCDYFRADLLLVFLYSGNFPLSDAQKRKSNIQRGDERAFDCCEK